MSGETANHPGEDHRLLFPRGGMDPAPNHKTGSQRAGSLLP